MGGAEERRHELVRAVDGEAVLDEVVRPDREEVDLAREEVGDHGGPGDLDHRADRHRPRLAVRHSLRGQPGGGLLEQRARPPDVLGASHHGEHDADVPFRRDP